MINEIFVSHWAPVVPIPCMTQAQLDNELERIFENMTSRVMGNYNEPGGSGSTIGRFKRNVNQEFDRGFTHGMNVVSDLLQLAINTTEALWLDGYDKGYKAGRDGEAKRNFGPAL
ncbi:hypothetical protein LCGC14_2229540 [marine sediment metagenome]|uniref:Uncharacterized protein n=1 Tax=marine sediment metagenome TaxID=412755 RepID=A0A0F9FL77_9ZZZZ